LVGPDWLKARYVVLTCRGPSLCWNTGGGLRPRLAGFRRGPCGSCHRRQGPELV